MTAPFDLPPRTPTDEAFAWLDRAFAAMGEVELAQLKSTRRPNVGDPATRDEFCRCQQCEQRSLRLYLYPKDRPRLVICRSCARSRIHAGRRLKASFPLERAS